MTRRTAPEWTELLKEPLGMLGDPMKVRVIAYLRRNGPATRSQIGTMLDLPSFLTARLLRTMTRAGLLLSDPAGYAVNEEKVSTLYLQFGCAIGEV